MSDAERFLAEHVALSRRYFLRCGVAGVAAGCATTSAADPIPPELSPTLEKLESYFTAGKDFGDVSRGKPVPHTLPEEKRREVGLTRSHSR